MKFIKQFKHFESDGVKNRDEYVESLLENFYGFELSYIKDKLEIFQTDTLIKIEGVLLEAISNDGKKSTLWSFPISFKGWGLGGVEPYSHSSLSDDIQSDIFSIQLITENPNWNPVVEISFNIELGRDTQDSLKNKKLIVKEINNIFGEYNLQANIHDFEKLEWNRWNLTLKHAVVDHGYRKIKESAEPTDTLIIVDVQKSFRKFFSEMYVNQLTKYCNNFQNVYLIWDNHVDGKNIDKEYLYDKKPDVPVHDDFYHFPNVKDRIEKRYNYDVDADFYKKILDKNVYQDIKNKESKGQLQKGNLFQTTEGTAIVYIGNNHKWFHIPTKLYKIFSNLKGKTIEIVGGSDSECLDDVVTAAESLGVIVKRNYKYIYSASHCPI